MEALHQLEIYWILFLQSLGDWLSEPMRLVSMLGQEEFYMLVMPLLYWCFDAVLGLRLAIMLILSNGTNAIFKVAFHGPRPYWIDPNVKALAVETSFGIPSGHAQNAASLWGLLAASSKTKDARIALVALIGLIGFSRLYLGVHFISDVILGWLAGGLLLLVFLKVEKRVAETLRTLSLRQMLALALLSSVLLGALMVLSMMAASSFTAPDAWQSNALLADPENIIEPYSVNGAFTLSGTWFGMLAGAAWLYHRRGGYNASGTPPQKLLRYVIGVAGVFVLWYLVGSVLPGGDDALSYGLRYARYSLVGLWISAFAPILFERLRLVNQHTFENASLSAPKNPL